MESLTQRDVQLCSSVLASLTAATAEKERLGADLWTVWYGIPPGEGWFPAPKSLQVPAVPRQPRVLHRPSCQVLCWQSGLISSLKHVTRIGLTKLIAESAWSLALAE